MSPVSRPRVIAIVGQTGSGKTSLGVRLAHRLQTEVISVDSMAVYRQMDVGTAKPTLEERDGIPHHLLDVVNPDEGFTAADFVSLARPVIERLHLEGKPTLLVGGTGLYLRALLHGLFNGPPTSQAFRSALLKEVEGDLAAGDVRALHRRLEAVDPAAAARLFPNDHVRIIRALEVYHLTGRSLSSWQEAHRFADERYASLKLCLELPREVLYQRINRRVLAMVEQGLEAETAALLERYGADVKPMKGLGYLHFVKRLRGEWSLEETLEQMSRDTRRFARRQGTWFRGEREVTWVPPETDAVWSQVEAFLAKQ